MSLPCPPVLLVMYKRPETTRRVFEAIRQVKPARLFIAQDYPPTDNPDDLKDLAETRAIATAVDWPCEVQTLFFDKNQSMAPMFDKAIRWFFEHVEEGIILEDDELADPAFFEFSAELLEKYRNDERVMCISGSNVLYHSKEFRPRESYYFLSIPSVWGVATWRRAWKHYDTNMKAWPAVRDRKLLYEVLPSRAAAFYFSKKFQGYYDHTIKSWDGQWVFACLAHKGLTIYPTKNLVSNIGFNMVSYHGYQKNDLWGNLPTETMSFPLIHPATVALDTKMDEYGVRIRYPRVDFNWIGNVKSSIKFASPDLYIAAKKLFYRTLKPHKYAEYVSANERSLLP